MRLVVIVVVMTVAGNALAQYSSTTGSEEYIDSLSIEQCRTDLRQCLADIGTAGADNTALLAALAERMGYSSVDEMLAADCRSRRGTWNGSECLCAEPNHWFGSDESCCVPSTRRYERQMHECRNSGGNFSCRGGCRCPLGTQLLDGACVGEAATREEIDRLRNRIPELESEVARLQAERDALRGQLDQAIGQLDELDNIEDTVAEMQQQLAEMDAELTFLRHLRDQYERHIERQALMIGELGGVPPLPPGISDEDDPLAPTPDILAAAAGGTERNPLAPPPASPEEEGDETWCEANPGWCTLVILGSTAAAAGLTLGICAAAGCFDSDEARVNWYR